METGRDAMRQDGRPRPRSAVGIMALIALPFLVGSGLSAAHQLARSAPEDAGVHASEAACASAGVEAPGTDRGPVCIRYPSGEIRFRI